MSILIRRVVTLALTLVTLTLLAACGPSNNVRLIYNTNTSAVLPLPGSVWIPRSDRKFPGSPSPSR